MNHFLTEALPTLRDLLSEAKASGDPASVLAAVHTAKVRFQEVGWPDARC